MHFNHYSITTLFVCLLLIVPEGATLSQQLVGAGSSNRSIDQALDETALIKTRMIRVRYKLVLFATNRKINLAAESKARQDQKILAIEDIFLSEASPGLAYGQAKVSYPANRVVGQQSFGRSSTSQNSLQHFSISEVDTFHSMDGFVQTLQRQYPDADQPTLLYVHGYMNSFSDAAERLTQLALDTNWRGAPVFFSWPSDVGRIARNFPVAGLPRVSYRNAAQFAAITKPFLTHFISDLPGRTKRPLDILAHSMGSKLLVDALAAKYAATAPLDRTKSQSVVILAAPDISTAEFTSHVAQIVETHAHVLVYCSTDIALTVSRNYNNSDERLGYCDARKSMIRGVEIVSIRGPISDFARHSYYLSSVEVIRDIERVFQSIPQNPTQFNGSLRTLEFNNR